MAKVIKPRKLCLVVVGGIPLFTVIPIKARNAIDRMEK
jgi:hypothetical protein